MRYRIAHAAIRKLPIADGFDSVLNPPGSGGLLAALYLWRKLLIGGPGKFGEVTYEGTRSAAGHDGLFDVLLASSDGVESRFYCDPADGQLVGMEMYPDEDPIRASSTSATIGKSRPDAAAPHRSPPRRQRVRRVHAHEFRFATKLRRRRMNDHNAKIPRMCLTMAGAGHCVAC